MKSLSTQCLSSFPSFAKFSRVFLFIIIAILTTSSSAIYAQPNNTGIVKGVVQDAATQAPLGYATISLFSVKDSALVTGGITDDAGIFAIPAASGTYYALIEFISYQTISIDNIEINPKQRNFDLGIVKLQAAAQNLGEVEVRAEKSSTQIMLDKRVFNVGKDLANTGGSAENILDNVPSVTVDVEGNVSLRGNENVRILIDGRPSGLVGLGNTNGLRQIPANMIDRVEVITNPSSRYEAEGTAGIINIILKKDRRKGINGAVEISGGYNGVQKYMPRNFSGTPINYGASVNLNYRRKDFNFFINTGINFNKWNGGGGVYQEFYNDSTTNITQQSRRHFRGGYSGNVRLGADYYITEKDVLTTSFLYRYTDRDNYTEVAYEDFVNNLNTPIGTTLRTDDENERDPNIEYVLSYKKQFQKKGRKLTADVRFQDNTETEGSDLNEYFNLSEFPDATFANLVAQQRANNVEGERVFIAQADYVHPFKEKGKFELGYRGSWRVIKNEYLVEDLDDNGEWQRIQSVSNDFNYDENIQAAYANVGDKINQFSYQLGLRYEYSFISTKLLQTNEINERSYPLPFFPSVFLSYDLPKSNSVQLSYSRRLRRPRFRELNPFFSFTDARNRYGGNPNLDPEFTHAFELNHVKYWDKFTITSSVYYRKTFGAVDRIRRVEDLVENGDTLTVTITQPENLAERDEYGFELTFNASPYKWWRVDGSFNFYRSLTDGSNIGDDLYADNISWITRLTSRFTVMKTDIQLRFNYQAPRRSTQGTYDAITTMDLGISRDFLAQKGTVTFSVRDLFNSRRWRYDNAGDNFYMEGDFQWRARSIRLSLSYRINQKKRRGGRGSGNYGGGGGGGF